MQVIIIGQNRAEFCNVKKNDKEKHFFMTRKQLYRVYPDGLTRMKVTRFGIEDESDEVIVYKENEIVPYHTRGLDYSANRFVFVIDEHKLLTSGSWFNKAKPWFTTTGMELWKLATSGGGIALLVIVLAFMGGR